jgi:dihydroorotate dehydrogenase (NAD+) catalytic subunit
LSEPVDLCGVALRGPVLNGSGTFDAIAARRVLGDALFEEFPFDAFVSKTITRHPRPGNPPHRLWEAPSGMINSIGLPNPGLEAFVTGDLLELTRRSATLLFRPDPGGPLSGRSAAGDRPASSTTAIPPAQESADEHR